MVVAGSSWVSWLLDVEIAVVVAGSSWVSWLLDVEVAVVVAGSSWCVLGGEYELLFNSTESKLRFCNLEMEVELNIQASSAL